MNQQERQLTIAGERRRKPASGEGAPSDEDAEAAARQQRRERRFGKFKRTLRLPETADSDAVSARCAPFPLLCSRAVLAPTNTLLCQRACLGLPCVGKA